MGSAWVTNTVSQMAEVLPPLDWRVGFKLGAVENTLNLDKFGVYHSPNSQGVKVAKLLGCRDVASYQVCWNYGNLPKQSQAFMPARLTEKEAWSE